MAQTKTFKELRLQLYESTTTNTGRVASNVWMDQYGRIMERRTDKNGKTDWHPIGECGCANH